MTRLKDDEIPHLIADVYPLPAVLEGVENFRETLMCTIQAHMATLLQLEEFLALISDGNDGFMVDFLKYCQTNTFITIEGEFAHEGPLSKIGRHGGRKCHSGSDHVFQRS